MHKGHVTFISVPNGDHVSTSAARILNAVVFTGERSQAAAYRAKMGRSVGMPGEGSTWMIVKYGTALDVAAAAWWWAHGLAWCGVRAPECRG